MGLSMLVAWDAAGNVIATQDFLLVKNSDGSIKGVVDFEAVQKSGESLQALWKVEGAVGSATWPEFLGGRAHDFRVETEGEGRETRIVALVHRGGHRRERSEIEAAIQARLDAIPDVQVGIRNGEPIFKKESPADIRDLVGGPDKPLLIDDDGRAIHRRLPSLKGGQGASIAVLGTI